MLGENNKRLGLEWKEKCEFASFLLLAFTIEGLYTKNKRFFQSGMPILRGMVVTYE